MVTTDGFPLEVVAKPVNRVPPEWYDPNDSRKEILLYFEDGSSIKIDSSVAKDPRLKKLGSLTPEEQAKLLKQIVLSRSLESISTGETVVEDVSRKEEEEEVTVAKVDLTPKRKVVIGSDNFPVSITAYYHDVIIQKPYIVLVYDNRAIGFSKFSPTQSMQMTLSIDDVSYRVVPIGLSFVYNDIEFMVFLHADEVEAE